MVSTPRAGLGIVLVFVGAMLALAWVFTASRVAHALIHVGPNIVKWRAIAFIVGVAIVLAMWLLLAWRILFGG